MAMRECRGFALNYFDDVVIYSKSIQEHLKHIILVLNCLKKWGFKIAPEKSTWCAKQVEMLGYVISGLKVSINPNKIITIKNRPQPKNAKQVQQAIGLFNFYRRFIDKFAEKSKCLYELIKKDAVFNFTEECKQAYNYFITCLTTEPAMAQPILGKPFIVYSDGSKYAIGGVLAQIIDGVEHIIEYASRLLKGAELNYGISDIECLALVFLIKKWHHYLYQNNFTLYTDHKCLEQLMSIKDYHGRLGRQAMFVQEYMPFTIKYLPGPENSAADIASRPAKFAFMMELRPRKRKIDEVDLNELEKGTIDPYDDVALMHYLIHKKHLPGLSKKHQNRIVNKLDHYRIMNNDTIQIKKDNIWKTIPLKEDRPLIIERAHLLGHFAPDSTFNRISEDYYWKNMLQQIAAYTKRCIPCARNKNMVPIHHPAKSIPVYGLFHRVGVDVQGGFPTSIEGYKKILVVKEYLTKLIRLYPMKTKSMEEITHNIWLWISQYSVMKELSSDRGSEFVIQMLDELSKNFGIDRRITSPYMPNSSGLVEKAGDTAVTILRTYSEGNQLRWPEYIPIVEFSYNSRKHSSTGFSPFELLYGQKTNSFINYTKDLTPDLNEERDLEHRSKQIKSLVTVERPLALLNIAAAQEKQNIIQDSRHLVTEIPPEIGTSVMIKNDGIIGKLEPRYHGRYTVVDQAKGGNYRLRDALGNILPITYPIQKLKFYEEDTSKPMESVEIERIIDKRKIDHVNQYLVKWKNLPASENEWVREDHFDDMKLVNEFNNSKYEHLNKPTEAFSPIEKPTLVKPTTSSSSRGRSGRGRAARVIATPYWQTILMCFLLALPLISATKSVNFSVNSVNVSDDFLFCDTSTETMVDFETNCITRTQTRTQFEEFALNPNMIKLANQLNANSTIYFHLAALFPLFICSFIFGTKSILFFFNS